MLNFNTQAGKNAYHIRPEPITEHLFTTITYYIRHPNR